jgi:hypothetical protein
MSKGGVVDCFKILSQHSPEGNEENNERTTFRIAGVLVEVLIGYPTHKNYLCYILNKFGCWNFVRTIRCHIESVKI